MKHIFLFISLFMSCGPQLFAQGVLVEDTIIQHLNIDDVNAIIESNGLPLGILPTNYEVDVHRVIYTTPDVHGEPTVASGLICLPTGDTCSVPMMAYLHGTKLLKEECFYFLNGEWTLGVIAATHGYAMCMPDYLGLGAGPGIHPYQHARSEATASVDILRACRTISTDKGLDLNGQLFIMGYSQGGHSTLATHRMIQEELSDEFTVTASAPGSGAYDMSGSQLDMVASFNSYAVPGYLPYLIQAYQEVYGNLYDSIQQIYIEPYDMTLPPLLDGSVGMGDVNNAMPTVPRDIIQPDYAEAFFSDTTHPAYLALKDNNVYEWVPQAPVLFNYCRMDEEVSYLNTITASEYMINAGAPHIEVIERDSTIGHFQCAQPAILFSKLWFDTMADFCSSHVGVQERETASLNIYPNPVTSGSVTFSNSESILVSVVDLQGKLLMASVRVIPNQALEVSKLGPGLFLAVIQQGDDQIVRKLIVQ